jgi:glycosyltransferase involved in cell wall biosynthesis
VLEARFLAGRLGRRPRRLAASALIPLLERTERRALDAADRVLVLSEYSRSLLAGRRPDAAATAIRVQGGVDVERFSPGDRVAARRALDVPSEATLVVAVRRLVERMGLEELVEACATLGADRPLQLVIAGTGPLGPDLAARIRRSGAPARLVGRVGEEALVDWLRAADLVVMPSVAYEGFGLVTAEALACGTPVLGTPVGATPEILAPLDDVLLADGADAGSLSRGIERALAQAGTLRDRCREYALERLSWERAMPAWEAAICGVAGER